MTRESMKRLKEAMDELKRLGHEVSGNGPTIAALDYMLQTTDMMPADAAQWIARPNQEGRER
jgi:hypothetical protein